MGYIECIPDVSGQGQDPLMRLHWIFPRFEEACGGFLTRRNPERVRSKYTMTTLGMKQKRFFQYLQYEKRFSPHTLAAYQNDLGQFFSFLEERHQVRDIISIHHTHIRFWIVHLLGEGTSARSVNRKLSCLKTYFKFLRKQGDIQSNPMTRVLAPKTRKRLPVFIHEQQMNLLFDEVDFGEGYAGLRNRLVMEMLYCTGMRRSELIGLKLHSMDFATSQLKVMGKGSKERLIPVSRHLSGLIRQFLDVRRAEFPETGEETLLLTDKGKPVYPGFVYNLVKKYLSAVTTLEQRSPHVLRHTFATHMSENGADLNAIKELLGHSSLAATQVYMHNSIEKLKKVYQQAHPKAKVPSSS